jgi:hypothetical protein
VKGKREKENVTFRVRIPNDWLLLTAHANDGSSCFNVFSRVRRQQSVLFGDGGNMDPCIGGLDFFAAKANQTNR